MSDIVLRYIGGGGYIPNVPARDMTAEDAARYGEIIAREEAASGTRLYEAVAPAQASKAAKEKPQEEQNG